jgi:GTPase SAR1 family protein
MDQVVKNKIQKELKTFNREQLISFAWLCAVRTIPFLTNSNGNFIYLNKKNSQKELYRIFSILDIIKYRTWNAHIAFVANEEINDVANFINNAFDVITTTNATIYAFKATFDASYVAYATYYNDQSAVNSFIPLSIINVALNTAEDAINAAVYANSAKDLASIILHDLIAIKNNEKIIQENNTDWYGKIWDNFQKALESEGCAYWGRLYKSIFDSGFVVDQKALERRMNVPKEIQEQGASAVAHYLEELETKGSARLNEARIIILGDKGAGKTCLAKKMIDPVASMTTDEESTAGVNTLFWKLKNENINVRIWDFAGHTVTHAVHQFFLSERCLYIMVYDGRTEERNRLEYWLNHMKNYGGDSQAFILVNKRDRHSVDIPINSLKEQYNIAGYYTFSIKNDKSDLLAFRKDVAEHIKNNPSWNKLEIPTDYYNVKDELEKIFTRDEKKKGKEHISKTEFVKIAEKYNIDNIDDLLKDLHSLGVSLWYKDMEEFSTLVLNPEWISQGVYRIINWVNEEKKYSLTLDDFKKVFKADTERYTADKHVFLFSLMQHYELAYEIKKEKRLIIPHLLKEDRPEILPEFSIADSLMLRYKAEQPLPPNTISRFIVRHNQEIKMGDTHPMVWRYGVVLTDGSNIALVREENRTISVSVKGINKTDYISKLRETLNDIFKSYKSKKPELLYRVERFGQIPSELEEKNPLWITDSKIFNHSIVDKPYYEDITGQEISMRVIAKNYNITAETIMIGGSGNVMLFDRSTQTFNFHDCNIDLQSNLNELSQLLTESGNNDDAKELTNISKTLEQAEKCESKEELKKKGIAGRLKRLAEELGDENSKLYNTVKGIKNGIGIAQDIAKGYNDIAQWAGLPQVPNPLLKKR